MRDIVLSDASDFVYSSPAAAIPGLADTLKEMLWRSKAHGTRITYLVGQRSYLRFAAALGIADPFPVREQDLAYWALTLMLRPVRYATLRQYISHVRSLHRELGFSDNFKSFHMLERVLDGIKRTIGRADARPRLPITVEMLRGFRSLLDLSRLGDSMLWAAVTTAFFGLLRSGELTGRSHGDSDNSLYPRVCDVTFDCYQELSFIVVHLRVSKSDPFRRGVDVPIGATGTDVCPVSAMHHYLDLRARCTAVEGGDPLFVNEAGHRLSYTDFVSAVKVMCRQLGINDSLYSGHSFRKGGASALAACGFPAHVIKAMGRWKSECYMLYISLPSMALASTAAVIARL